MKNSKKVAVTFANGLGNFISFTPTLYALHEIYDAKIDLYIDSKWTDSRRPPVERLFNQLSYANEIIEYNPLGFIKDNYEAIYWSSHGEKHGCWYDFEKMATLKAQFDEEDDSWLHIKEHEVDFYINPLYENGYRGKVPKQLKGIEGGFVPVAREYNISQHSYYNRLRIGFCNGFFEEGSWDWSRKVWSYFSELGLMIKNYFGNNAHIYLLGKGKGEREWAKSVKASITFQDYNVKNFVDKLDILATMRKMCNLDMLITTDTGLMHVADAIGIPLIALFGSTLVSKNGPYNKVNARIVHSLVGCSPCQDTPQAYLCKDYKCMREISPGDVFGTLLSFLDDLGYVYNA